MGNSVENAILRKAGVENGATAERAEIQGSEGSRWKGDAGKWNQQEKETEIKTGKKQRMAGGGCQEKAEPWSEKEERRGKKGPGTRARKAGGPKEPVPCFQKVRWLPAPGYPL